MSLAILASADEPANLCLIWSENLKDRFSSDAKTHHSTGKVFIFESC